MMLMGGFIIGVEIHAMVSFEEAIAGAAKQTLP